MRRLSVEETKRMPDLRKYENDRSKRHWAFVEATASRVEDWPSWKQAGALTAVQTAALQEREQGLDDQEAIGEAYAAD